MATRALLITGVTSGILATSLGNVPITNGVALVDATIAYEFVKRGAADPAGSLVDLTKTAGPGVLMSAPADLSMATVNTGPANYPIRNGQVTVPIADAEALYSKGFAFLRGGVSLSTVPVALPAPAGLQWVPGHTFSMVGANYTSNLNDSTIISYIPAATVVYYVDPVNGADGNAGTRAAPLRSLSVAIGKADVDQVRLINMTADIVARSSLGWGNAGTTRSISVINENPQFRFITSQASGTVNTWAPTPGSPGVYQNARSTSPTSVTDCTVKHFAFYMTDGGTGYSVGDQFTLPNGALITVSAIDKGGVILAWAVTRLGTSLVSGGLLPVNVTGSGTGASFRSATHAPAVYAVARKVADLATCAANRGTWFDDGTNTYYNPIDGRALPASSPMIVLGVTGACITTVSAANTIYLSGIDTVGGTDGLRALYAGNSVKPKIVINDVSFQGTGAANGFNIAAFVDFIGYKSGAYYAWADGWCIHSNESDGTTTGTSPTGILSRCVAQGNGTTGSTGVSDNDFTSHDDAAIVLHECIGCGSDDRVFAFVGKSRTWVLGGICGSAKSAAINGRDGFALLDSAQAWVDGLITPAAVPGGSQRWNLGNTSVGFYRNVYPTPTNPFGQGRLETF